MTACRDCRSWRPPHALPWKQGEHAGTCHRYPPQVITLVDTGRIEAKTHWPRTYHFDGCGEYQPDAPRE